MELFDTLASVGLTARVLQIMIISAIVILLAGIFWRYIVLGAGILFCVVVFAMPSGKPIEANKPMELPPIVVTPQEQVVPEPKVTTTDEEMFLEDCGLHSGYTPAQCTALWKSNQEDIQKSAWKYKHGNKKYIQKVKYGV